MATGIIRLDQGWRLDEGHHFDMPPQIPAQFDFMGGPPAQPKTKGKTMDYIPKSRSERYLWWKNFCDNIEAEGPKVGLTAAEIAAIKTAATDQCVKMEAANAAENAAKGAKAIEMETTRLNTQAIRLAIRNIKTRTLYANSGVEGTLRLKGSESTFDPATFKPALKLSIVGGQVRVDFTKGECDSVAVYCRVRGTIGWTKLGIDTDSPYFDTKPLANPNVPEVREYMARGVIEDAEIGIESDIVSIALAG
jgi:hypothetical protein